MAQHKDLSIDGTSPKLKNNNVGGFNDVGSDGMRTTEISDSAVINETSLNKMATSIPTPFARLYLYDTAFSELNALEEKDAHSDVKIKPYKTISVNATLYHHLAAECLDLIEFIFEYGADKRFSIHKWNVIEETKRLGAQDSDTQQVLLDDGYGEERTHVDEIGSKHKKLGTALRDAIKNTKLSSMDDIYLFKWDNEIVGGTSPFTLVYVSPNWRRNMRAKHLGPFYGSKGNVLFQNIDTTSKVWSLNERSDEFKMYMFALATRYASDFARSRENGGKLYNLNEYINNTKDHYDTNRDAKSLALISFEEMNNGNFDDRFDSSFKELKHTQKDSDSIDDRQQAEEQASVGGVHFYTKMVKPDENSEYKIVPTVDEADLPVETGRNDTKIGMKDRLPLVLSSKKLSKERARYWYLTPYNPNSLPVRPEGEYYERILPGVPGNEEYPYITLCDILEDSIMYLGYNIDKDRFFTGFKGSSGFLLPLKPTFFKYFRVEDLPKMVKVTPDASILSQSVTVSVDIPVKGGTVNFSRTYSRNKPNEIIDFSQKSSFKLGIFPFYTYAGTDAADEDAYKVLLARTCDLKLDFFNKDFVTPLGQDVVRSTIRTEKGNMKTEYYALGTRMTKNEPGKSGSFTAIRLIKDGIGGMIIPKFFRATTSEEKYVFCVDFGTANTNIAYAVTSGQAVADGMVFKVKSNDIHTLDYSPASSQMAMLNEEGAEGNADNLNPLISSEFVPKSIGKGEVKFPIRTIACARNTTLPVEPDLFGDANIAFYTDRYNVDEMPYSYHTDLKWGMSFKKLNRVFFQEILWLCKNKVAELGGNAVFEFYFTYPQTMSGVSLMMRAWKEAAENIRTRAHVFDFSVKASNERKLNIYEGIAPWYRTLAIPGKEVNATDSFLNVDIGGGSTDIVYITRPLKDSQREMQGYSFSAKFAANDLWGDGVRGTDYKTNGFLQSFMNEFLKDENTQDAKLKRELDSYIRHANKSEDVIGYLFAHPNYYFSDHLVENEKLRTAILMHFAATMYYVGRTLAMQQLALPKHISFSGMGSLYLKYLSNDTDVFTDTDALASVIKVIFKYAGLKVEDKEGKEKPLSVHFAEEPKKITAEGGLLMYNTTLKGVTDKVVRSESVNFHLYEGEDEEEEEVTITLADLHKYRQPVINEVKNFLGLFNYRPFVDAVANELGGMPPRFNMDKMTSWVDDGYDIAMEYEYPERKEDDTTKIKDVLFFWPLKHAIYMIGRAIAKGEN